MAGHGPGEAEPGEGEAAERGLDQEGGEAGAGVEEAEEAHEGLALPEVRDRLRLQHVVDEGGQHGREGDGEGEVAQQGHAPDLGPAAPAVLRSGRTHDARGAPRPTNRTPATEAAPVTASATSSARGDSSAATRSAPTPPTRPPKAAAAATRARSALAEWGSNRSLSSDQKAEIAIPPSTEEWR